MRALDAQIGTLDRIEQVAAGAVGLPPTRRIGEGQEDAATVRLEPEERQLVLLAAEREARPCEAGEADRLALAPARTDLQRLRLDVLDRRERARRGVVGVVREPAEPGARLRPERRLLVVREELVSDRAPPRPPCRGLGRASRLAIGVEDGALPVEQAEASGGLSHPTEHRARGSPGPVGYKDRAVPSGEPGGDRTIDELSAGARLGRALLEAVPDLVFVIGRDGIYRAVKAEHPEDLAAPPDQLIGSRIDEVLPPDVAERIMTCSARALERNSVEAVDYTLVLGGSERLFEGRVAASGDDEFLLIVRDATERKRQEGELRRLATELEDRLAELGRERDFTRTLVRSVPSFLALADAEGKLLGLNDSLQAATGFLGDETTGSAWDQTLIAPEQRSDARRFFAALLTQSEPAPCELDLLTRFGDRHIVEWSGTPVTDQFGLVRVILCGVDVTERVRQEAELRRSRTRIVEASDAERRRLQRNLHDGAQQHLVVVSQQLRLARVLVERDVAEAAALLDRAIESMAVAHRELRELARGLHPALLTDRGLPAAIRALALRSPVPVQVELEDGERFPGSVEAAVYYIVAESLTNVVKYAQASAARVRIVAAGSPRPRRRERRRRGWCGGGRRLRPARSPRSRRGARGRASPREPARRRYAAPRPTAPFLVIRGLGRRLPPVLRQRDFALLFVALLGTGLASQMVAVAIGWQVYAIRGNPFDLGLIGLAEFLPLLLLAVPAGPSPTACRADSSSESRSR